jgi:ribonuclease HI
MWGRLLRQVPAKLWCRAPLPMSSTRRAALIPKTHLSGFAFALCGDNLQVIEDSEGVWSGCKGKHADLRDELRWVLHAMATSFRLRPWPGQVRLLHHRRRYLNVHSDALANRALDVQCTVSEHRGAALSEASKVILCFDGAARGGGSACAVGCGVWIFHPGCAPVCVAALGVPLGHGTNVQAEYTGALFACLLFLDWVRTYHCGLGVGDVYRNFLQ